MEQNNKNSKEKETNNPSINNSNLFVNFPDKSGEKQFAGSSYFNFTNGSKKSDSSNNKTKKKRSKSFSKKCLQLSLKSK